MTWTRKRIRTNSAMGNIINDGPPVWDGHKGRFRIVEGKEIVLIDYYERWQSLCSSVEQAIQLAEERALQHV